MLHALTTALVTLVEDPPHAADMHTRCFGCPTDFRQRHFGRWFLAPSLTSNGTKVINRPTMNHSPECLYINTLEAIRLLDGQPNDTRKA